MTTEVIHDASQPSDGAALVKSLLGKCQRLLTELEEFREFAEQRKLYRYSPVEIGQLKSTVRSEYRSLQKVIHPSQTFFCRQHLC